MPNELLALGRIPPKPDPYFPRWICFYGPSLPADLYFSLDLAILDPDSFQIPKVPPHARDAVKHPVRIGYLSVGEAEDYRWYWPEIRNKDFVLEENPHWKGAHYVDIRSQEWQDYLLDVVIPRIVSAGYDGLFLDTLDTAELLENRDSVRFAGSLKAVENFVRTMKDRYPHTRLIPNNAFPLINRWGGLLDGVVVEDLYTRYDFSEKSYGRTPSDVITSKEGVLTEFLKNHKRPVYVLLYAPPEQKDLSRWASRQCRKRGFWAYQTTVDLNRLGRISP